MLLLELRVRGTMRAWPTTYEPIATYSAVGTVMVGAAAGTVAITTGHPAILRVPLLIALAAVSGIGGAGTA